MESISLVDQIKCVEREIALRKSAYPKWAESGRMKQATAEREIAAMEMVLESLKAYKQLAEQSLKRVLEELKCEQSTSE